jgi:serine protease Do
LLAVFTAAGALAQSAPISPEELHTLELIPGVVLVEVTYKVTTFLPVPGPERARMLVQPFGFMGSGFLYRPDGYLITNAHVVTDANSKDPQSQAALIRGIQNTLFRRAEGFYHRELTDAEKRVIVGTAKITTAPIITVYLNNKTHHIGEIKAYSDPTGVNLGKDIAIIKIDANDLPTVNLGNSDDVHVEEPVTVVGFPGAASAAGESLGELISEDSMLVPTVTNGHISAVKQDYKGSTVLQSDAAITHGNSGGPAFDPDGKVIGIATFGPPEAAGFNFFVPINTAMEFVRQAGAPPASSTFDSTWHGALDAMAAHRWSRAHELIGQTLEIMPGEPDALRMQVIAAHEEQKEMPMWPYIAGGGALLLALIAVIGWLVSSSKKKKADAAPAPVRAEAVKIPLGENVRPAAAPGVPLAATVFQSSSDGKNYGSLQVTSGPQNGTRFPITKNGLTIGRDSAKCAIAFGDEAVSKEHAWIGPVDNDIVIMDRNSTNGTYVNSVESPKIGKATLRSGDKIFIGRNGLLSLTYFSS